MKTIIIILLTSTWLIAQISLEQLVDESIANNPLLKVGKNRYLAKEFKALQEGILPDPMLGFTQWIEPVETRVGAQQNIYSLSQKIPFPGKLGLKEDIVSTEARSDKYSNSGLKLDIINKVKINYFDLYLADHSLLILQNYFSLLKDFVDAASAKYSTGQGIQAHVLKAQVEYSTIQSRIFDLQRKRNTLQTRLNQLRSVEPNTPIMATQDLDTSVAYFDVDSLYKRFERHPLYLAAMDAKNQSVLQKELAFKNWYPDFTIQANYITVKGNNPNMADNGKDAWGVMVGINLPLWYTGRKAQVEQSHYNELMRQDLIDNIRNQLQTTISDLVFKAKSLQETISLYRFVLLPQAEISLKSALSAYRSGTFGFLDLLESERMLLLLRLAFLQEKVNYRKTIADLERAVGMEIPK